MLFYKHKNSFILPPHVRVRTRTTMTSFLAGKSRQMGGYSPRTYAYARMTSLPCVRTQRHLHTQKLLTFFGGKIFPYGGAVNSIYLPGMITFSHLAVKK